MSQNCFSMVKYILVRPLTLVMLENDICLGYSF